MDIPTNKTNTPPPPPPPPSSSQTGSKPQNLRRGSSTDQSQGSNSSGNNRRRTNTSGSSGSGRKYEFGDLSRKARVRLLHLNLVCLYLIAFFETHVLTYATTIISLHLHTTTNAHLPGRYHTKSRRGLQIILISRIILLETSQRLLERLCLNIYLREILNQVIRFVVV